MFFIEFFLMILSGLGVVVGVLISVAFMVLLERSVLGYIQLRKGPNKVGFTGVLQSFGDAIKLFIKEQFSALTSNFFIFYMSPIISLFLMMLLWMVAPFFSVGYNFFWGGLFFFCCASMGVYALMGSGWSSNSNYALLGAVRGVAQTISYEVGLALIFLSIITLSGCYSFYSILELQNIIYFILVAYPIFLCWGASSLAETNRTPFDFAEGESELVSGFNIEYGSGGFALLFLAEYGSIIFMSYLIVFLFFGGLMLSYFLLNLLGLGFCFWFIWVRGTMPRHRYDKLMGLAWKCYLPVSLFYLFFYFGLMFILL